MIDCMHCTLTDCIGKGYSMLQHINLPKLYEAHFSIQEKLTKLSTFFPTHTALAYATTPSEAGNPDAFYTEND